MSRQWALIDFILNLAGLLLWLNWRAAKADPLGQTEARHLDRHVAPRRAGQCAALASAGGAGRDAVAARAVLLANRFGLETVWAGNTGSRSHRARRFPAASFLRACLLFSIFSFALMFGMFYLWLLLLSILAGPMPTHRLVKIQLGKMDGWPRWIKILLPLAVTALVWWLASWLLAWLHIIPPAGFAGTPTRGSAGHRAGELSRLEISDCRAAGAAFAEQLHLFRQTSVLELRERDGKKTACGRWKKSRCARAGRILRRSWALRWCSCWPFVFRLA